MSNKIYKSIVESLTSSATRNYNFISLSSRLKSGKSLVKKAINRAKRRRLK